MTVYMFIILSTYYKKTMNSFQMHTTFDYLQGNECKKKIVMLTQ